MPRQFSVVLLFYIIISSWRPKPQLRDQTGSFPTRRGTCVRSIKINYCGAECWRLKRCQLRMANCWLKNTDRVQMFSILSSHPHSVFLFCYLILVWFLRITIRKVSNYRAKYPESSLFMLQKNRNFPKIQTLVFLSGFTSNHQNTHAICCFRRRHGPQSLTLYAPGMVESGW